MHKNSKILLTLLGTGLLLALTGCGGNETGPLEMVPIESSSPQYGINPVPDEEPSTSQTSKPVDETTAAKQALNPVTDSEDIVTGKSGETHQEKASNTLESKGTGTSSDVKTSDPSPETELIALADTQEEAERIAKLYGITLKSFSYGVAVYTTDKDPMELFTLGEKKNYPTLSLNHTQHIYGSEQNSIQ